MSDDADSVELDLAALAYLDQAQAEAREELRSLAKLGSTYKTLLVMEGFTEHGAEDIVADFLSQTYAAQLAMEEVSAPTEED